MSGAENGYEFSGHYAKEISASDFEEIPLDFYGDAFDCDGNNDPSPSSDLLDYLSSNTETGISGNKDLKRLDDEQIEISEPQEKKEVKQSAPKNQKKRHDLLKKNTEALESFWVLPESIRETLLGRLAESVSEAYEFPEFSTLMTLMGAASAAVSCNYTSAYSNGKPLNAGLYVVVEQPPATGKSRLLDTLMVPYEKAMGAHNRKVAVKNREIAERGIETPTMPPSFVNTTEPTSAAMDGAMSRFADGRFVVASSEQSAFTMLFPQGKAFASTNELLLKGWPGEQTAIMRGSRQSFSGTACGSIVLVAQDGSARTVLGESGGTGLAERFIFIAEPSLLGHRELLGNEPDGELLLCAKNAITLCVNAYSDKVFDWWSSGVYEQITPDDLTFIQPTPEGYKFINELKQDIEPRLGVLKDAGHLVAVGWLGKADAHILKIATVIHVFECLGAGSKVPQRIPIKIIEAASDLVFSIFEYFTGMLADNGESGSSAEEDAIIESLSYPLVRRALLLKLKNRQPFRALGKNAYSAASRRIDAMLEQGSLVVNTRGYLEVV